MDKFYSSANKFARLQIGFILIFIISLTNSIFLNQIGYFGALLILLIQWYKTKENKFYSTGLELAFILFLSAELISALLSINQPEAFKTFFKRLVLIPIVYVIVVSADSYEKAKLFAKVFVIAAILTVIAYLFVAYRHYILQLYRLESKGPSVFQYVMTAGGLMSFVTIILFAFVINEKTKFTTKLVIITAFIISAVGLISSYTRAAWIGAIAGIMIILILKRKWLYLAPIVCGTLLLIFFSKKESKIWVYSLEHQPELINSFNTNGRAVGVESVNGFLYVADYEKGVKVIDSAGTVIESIATEAPATRINRWGHKYILIYLIDSRFLIGELKPDGKLQIVNKSVTPGLTRDLQFVNESFYTADVDAGVTVFNNPLDTKNQIRLINLPGIERVQPDSNTIVVYNSRKSQLQIFANDCMEKFSLTDSIKIYSPTYYLWKFNHTIFFQTDNKLLQYYIDENKFQLVNETDIKGIFRMLKVDSLLYSAAVDGRFYKAVFTTTGKIEFILFHDKKKNLTDITIGDGKIIASTLQLNRLASIIDPYHETNIERIRLWSTGFKIFLDYPLFGVGDIDLGKIYSEYKPDYVKENYGHLHNNYIHFLVILGSVGFLAVLFLLYKIFSLNLKIYRALKNVEFASSYSLGTFSAFVGFLVSGLAEWNFGDQEIITMVWFTIGLNIAFYRLFNQNKLSIKTDA
ncbi:MAG: O-antigen ligase family protein [Bacteroidota bacterium]